MTVPFGELPEHLQQAIRAQHDRHEMIQEAEATLLKVLFEEVTEDQLLAIRVIVNHCEGNWSWFYAGQIAQVMEKRFGVCIGCGQKHGAEDLLKEPNSKTDLDTHEPQPEAEENITGTQLDGDPSLETLDELKEDHPMWEQLLDEFNMEYVPIPGNPDMRYLRCAGCKTPSASMADRMLRAPGTKGCSPCQQKAKWG